MKKPIIYALCALLLVGFGCSSSPADDETTSDTSSDWWLGFDLPEGWVMVRHYSWDQLISEQEPIDTSLTDVVLQSTDKNIIQSSGWWPDDEQFEELGGEDQFTGEDYTHIRVVRFASNSVIPSEAEDLGDGFYRVEMCEEGEDCTIGGSSRYEYYLELEDNKYKFYISQRDQDLSVAEEVIFSAVEQAGDDS